MLGGKAAAREGRTRGKNRGPGWRASGIPNFFSGGVDWLCQPVVCFQWAPVAVVAVSGQMGGDGADGGS